MGRKVNKPILRVNSYYLGEVPSEQAFADFFYLGLMEKLKSSGDTIGSCGSADYNGAERKEEDKHVS